MFIDSGFVDVLKFMLDTVVSAGATKAVVTGGAIRDMLFEKPIKDIDIFYEGPDLDKDILKECFSLNDLLDEDTGYGEEFIVTHPKLHYYDKDEIPIPIQLIKVENVLHTIEDFPFAFCKNHLDSSGLFITKQSMEVHHNKYMYHPTTVDEKYLNRMKLKYQDYKFHPQW